ncbi:MAG TPA: RnfH family protein [Woeseiaceae bacterium]
MSETNPLQLHVEVVYALPERQELITLVVEAGTTVQQAIDKSSLAELFPERDLERCRVGIWGHVAERAQLVQNGDRIELYRELLIDPRDARRSLATTGRTMGRGKD